MDFQKFVDSFAAPTCIISVEKLADGGYGEIRIVTGNKLYIQSIEATYDDSPKLLVDKFIPNSEYQRYFPKDLNFEDFCYRSAILKQPQHSYVHPDRFDFWFDLFSLPIESDDEKLAYCTYTQEVTHKPNMEKMGMLSYETSSDVLSACLSLKSSDDFDTAIQDVIEKIRDICHAQYGCIMLVNNSDCSCKILGQDFSKDSNFHTNDNWFDNFYEIAKTWESLIGGSNCLIIKNQADWDYVKEHNKTWYDSLILSGVESMVMFPLKANGRLMGYIWATNFATEDTVRIKETLELTTFFIAAEISNHLLFDRLKVLSTMDSLTGVMNRNEMNNRVDQIADKPEWNNKSLGIVFTDVNGLKKTNDVRGHLAGDILLKEATNMLKKMFPDDEIYRAGGDEFMVLCLDADEASLKEKIKDLKKQLDESDTVSFAVGWIFVPSASNILSAMTKADRNMYEDKELYYAEHPEKKRWNQE